MAVSPKQYEKDFLTTETAIEIRELLRQMEANPRYATKPSYSPGSAEDISFCDKHFLYISTHPTTRPHEYLANLRLMTKLY